MSSYTFPSDLNTLNAFVSPAGFAQRFSAFQDDVRDRKYDAKQLGYVVAACNDHIKGAYPSSSTYVNADSVRKFVRSVLEVFRSQVRAPQSAPYNYTPLTPYNPLVVSSEAVTSDPQYWENRNAKN